MDKANPAILLDRDPPGAGDVGILLRAAEIIKLQNPRAWIGIRSRYPELIQGHPALDGNFSVEDTPIRTDDTEFPGMIWNPASPGSEHLDWLPRRFDRILRIPIRVHHHLTVPKHQAYIDLVSQALERFGYDGILWDGKPQQFWITRSARRLASDLVRRTAGGKIPIGIFWRSSMDWKDWDYYDELIGMLLNTGRFAVYCFDQEKLKRIPGVINIINYPLDEVSALVSCLELVIGNDSAGLHIAGGVGTPIIGLFGATDPACLISMYPDSHWFSNPCPKHPCWFKPKCVSRPCLKEIPAQSVFDTIIQRFPTPSAPALALPGMKPHASQLKALVARFIGLGDVLMLWFALEQFKRDHPDIHLALLTSPEAASLFYGQEGLVDEVIISTLKHHHGRERVRLPINEVDYDRIFCLINRVDFGKIVYKRPRVDNFALLMGVELDADLPVRKLQVTDDEREWFATLRGGADRVIAFQMDSNGLPRKWFPGHFQELAWKIYKAYGDSSRILCVGSNINSSLKLPPNVLNLAGYTDIRQYVSILVLSDLIVCTDSSGLHIGARAERAKVIGLFGSTGVTKTGEHAHINRYKNIIPICSDKKCSPCWDWQLKNCQKKLRYPVCLWRIKPDRVFQAIQEEWGG